MNSIWMIHDRYEPLHELLLLHTCDGVEQGISNGWKCPRGAKSGGEPWQWRSHLTVFVSQLVYEEAWLHFFRVLGRGLGIYPGWIQSVLLNVILAFQTFLDGHKTGGASGMESNKV